MNSRLQWALSEINNLKSEYDNIVATVDNYAKQNNYSFDLDTAYTAYGITLGATLLREESKWNSTTAMLSLTLVDLGMKGVINKALNINRTINDYANNTNKLSSDLDMLYNAITKSAMYTFYYVLALYSKITNKKHTSFGIIDEIMCAINDGTRNQDTAKTMSNNYIYNAYAATEYFTPTYTFNNYYNWIRTGFICDTVIHSGK